MNYLTVKQVAERTGLSPQTARKLFPVVKFGRSVRIAEGELTKFANRRAIAAIQGDPGLRNVMELYRTAELVVGALHPDRAWDGIADPDMAALMVSSVAACRFAFPDWHQGPDAAPAPVLAVLKANPPWGGGATGELLRAWIEAA